MDLKELKDKLKNAKSKEEVKDVFEKSRIELSNEDLENISGGYYTDSNLEELLKYYTNQGKVALVKKPDIGHT